MLVDYESSSAESDNDSKKGTNKIIEESNKITIDQSIKLRELTEVQTTLKDSSKISLEEIKNLEKNLNESSKLKKRRLVDSDGSISDDENNLNERIVDNKYSKQLKIDKSSERVNIKRNED